MQSPELSENGTLSWEVGRLPVTGGISTAIQLFGRSVIERKYTLDRARTCWCMQSSLPGTFHPLSLPDEI